MAKNSFNWNIVGWIAVIGLAMVLINKMGNIGTGSVVNINTTINEVPLEPEKINPSYNVGLSVSPASICEGDSALGIINSNIPSGFCSIYINTGSGFVHLKLINLDGSGRYSENNVFSSAGYAQLRAVCCDSQMSCKASNDAYLTVRECETSPSDKYLCCNAMGVNSCYKNACPPAGVLKGTYNSLADCNAGCTNAPPPPPPKGYKCCSVKGIKGCYLGTCPSGSLTIGSYLTQASCLLGCKTSSEPPVNPPPVTCVDSDSGMSLVDAMMNKGSCVDSLGTHWDSCDDNINLRDWYCENNICKNAGTRSCSAFVNTGSTCSDGACILPTNYHCTDSDNGKVYTVKGTTDDDFHNAMSDYCIGTSLYEYYCPSPSSKFDYELKQCSMGCDNGICVGYCNSKRSGSENSNNDFTFGTGNVVLDKSSGGGTGFYAYTLKYNLVNAQVSYDSQDSVEGCKGATYSSDTLLQLGDWNVGQRMCVKQGNKYFLLKNHALTALWALTIDYDYGECGG